MNTLNSSMLSLSLGMYGCRVVQKLLECVGYEHKKSIAKQLKGSIINFVYDQNGNHVLQKMIECLRSQDIAFVADEIIGHSYSLAVHPYGCRIIQRLLEKVCRKKARPLLNEIKQHTVALSKNQYGNYIIQWIIKNCTIERNEVLRRLVGRVAELSREKFASNVIEEAFKRSNNAQVKMLAEELLHDTLGRKERFSAVALLVNDQFGNYVVQTLLDKATEPFRERLLLSLSKCGKYNQDYGKHLLIDQMIRS